MGADTPELRALYEAERELFPPASGAPGTPWPDELPFPVAATEDRPRVHASGLSPTPPESTPPVPDQARDLAWLSKLEMPDIPVRWDARVVRYLEFFKDDPRGRSTMTTWLRRSGRYLDAMRKTFRAKGLPEDMIWLAMVESGFDASARSPAGAAGLWQFMPNTGKIYGLSVDRWADQRMNPSMATEAAADFLADLYRRFGSWDLAMAGYNMGYGGVLVTVRKYNTNDFWALTKLEGAIPWETSLYVPKIQAVAVVMHNRDVFGYRDVATEAPLDGETVSVGPGTTLATVARACNVATKDLEDRNPDLRASRTPPAGEDWPVRVPSDKVEECRQNLSKSRSEPSATEPYVVRFGETLEQIAEARGVSVDKLTELNGIGPGEVVKGGTVLLVPKTIGDGDGDAKRKRDKSASLDPDVVVVPPSVFVYPDRRRVFYRVRMGDTSTEIGAAFGVSNDELRQWNGIDPSARLVEGMTLQVFVPKDADLSKTAFLDESAVRVVATGTDEFFEASDDKGRTRLVVTAKAGDTLTSIGKTYGVSPGMMERINRRGRKEVLDDGEQVVVWADAAKAKANTPRAEVASTEAR